MSDSYDDLVVAYQAMPADERTNLGDALFTMILDGPPASVAFLERVVLDVVSPVRNDEPLPGVANIEETLDAIASGEFLSLGLVLCEMSDNRPEASARFLRVLGRMFGESMQRSRKARGPLDPDTQAFVDVIVGYFDDE